MSNEQTEALREGMVPWAGGDTAPADWDRNEPVMFRDGRTMRQHEMMPDLEWAHRGGKWAFGDIIAYTPKRATPSPAPSDTLERREAIKAAVKRARHEWICTHGVNGMGVDDAITDAILATTPAPREMEAAIMAVVEATRAYLPPDGIDAQECISRILAATDNPEINPIIRRLEDGHS